MMLCPALLFACFLHGSLASICNTGDGAHDGITQNPPEVKAKEGDNVSFNCTIDNKYNVMSIKVRKDGHNVMIRDVSDVIHREENFFFGGTNHHFTITLKVRNKSDSNTYYCDAVVQGQPPEICGAGTFIRIPVTDTGFIFRHEIVWPIVIVIVVLAILVICFMKNKNKKKTND